jgi:proteasome lid subunit RPN8/RPN11
VNSLTLDAEGRDDEEVVQAVFHGSPGVACLLWRVDRASGVAHLSNSYIVSIFVVTDLRIML